MKRTTFLLTLLTSLALFGTLMASAQTMTFTNNGGGNACLVANTQDGQPIGDGNYVCFQTSAFDNSAGFSLYLPLNPDPSADGYALKDANKGGSGSVTVNP